MPCCRQQSCHTPTMSPSPPPSLITHHSLEAPVLQVMYAGRQVPGQQAQVLTQPPHQAPPGHEHVHALEHVRRVGAVVVPAGEGQEASRWVGR
jgi:hypothetical protein